MKSYLLIPTCLVLAFSCKKDPPVVPEPTLSLAAVDASCIEAWLRVTTADIPATVRLLRDGQPVSALGLRSPDSLIIDEGLLPKRSYTYQLHKLAAGSASGGDSSVIETSANVQVTTMDTTSHNYTWQIDTLGDGGGSVLYDVAIINDTLVYAVGEIWKRDSSGNWVNPPFNIARWNGHRWELMRRLFDCRLYYPNCGPEFFLFTPIRAIFAFGPDDIWVAAGTAQHFDGANWTEHAGVQGVGSANKIWGSSSDDLWFVGNNGFTVHKSGTTWRQLESGTTLPIQDVYGSVDTRSRKTEVLAVASDPWHGYAKKIIGISAQSTTAVSDSGIPEPLSGVWFTTNRKYYTVGSGIFTRLNLNRGKWFGAPNQLTPYYSNAVRGTALNDIIVVGAYWDILHFNGWSWQSYPELLSPGQSWYRVSMEGNRVVAVGYVGNRAAVLRGVRQ